MKIAVAGLGYVGMSNAVLLTQHNEVVDTTVIFLRRDGSSIGEAYRIRRNSSRLSKLDLRHEEVEICHVPAQGSLGSMVALGLGPATTTERAFASDDQLAFAQ